MQKNYSKILTARNTAFYTGCTDESFWEAVVTMRSVQKEMPGIQCYVLAKYISKKFRRILEKSNIHYVRVDLAEFFSREWKNPLVSYLVFAGPEIIKKDGYDYAIYVKPGVICRESLLNKGLKNKDNILQGAFTICFDAVEMSKRKLLETTEEIYRQRLRDRLPDTSWEALFGEFCKAVSYMAVSDNSFTDDETIFRQSYRHYYWWRWVLTSECVRRLFEKEMPKQKKLGRPLKVYWYRNDVEEIRNFGDELPRDLIPRLFNRDVELAPIDNCQMITVGSILEVATEAKKQHKIKVWGSGFIRAKKGVDNLKNLDFRAVRGSLSEKRVGEGLAVGDPGLLVNLVYQKKHKNGLVGVVVHYVDYDSPLVRRLRKDERFLVINTLDEPERVAKQISACKLILSSSLHGLIFADSYGVPNIHLKLSNKLTGGDYKFEDYYSGIEKVHLIADKTRIFDDDYLLALIRAYQPLRNLKDIQGALIDAFPFSGVSH